MGKNVSRLRFRGPGDRRSSKPKAGNARDPTSGEDDWESKVSTLDTETRNAVRKSRDTVNFLVVGGPGVGKSTLITSLRVCLTQNAGEELASAGVYTGGQSATMRLRRHALIPGDDTEGDHAPVAFDMPGWVDIDDHVTRTILERVMQGIIPIGEDFNVHRQVDVGERFSVKCENKIDRVVFVHSCNEAVPENLIAALKGVCSSLDIAIFSVLTHIDEDPSGHACSQTDLERALGIAGSARSCAVELHHEKGEGQFLTVPRTNYYLLQLVKELLNVQCYTVHSTHG